MPRNSEAYLEKLKISFSYVNRNVVTGVLPVAQWNYSSTSSWSPAGIIVGVLYHKL